MAHVILKILTGVMLLSAYLNGASASIYPTDAAICFYQYERDALNYHLYTKAWYSNAETKVDPFFSSNISFYTSGVIQSNFSMKTNDQWGTTWQYTRSDTSLTSNYEVDSTDMTYDGTNGDASVTDDDNSKGDDSKEDSGILASILDVITSIPTKIIDFLTTILNTIIDLLTSVVDFINNFFSNLLEFLKNLFIPSSDFIEEQKEKLTSSFAFVDEVKTLFSDLYYMMNSNYPVKAPELNIDLSKIESKYYKLEGTVNFLDFSWFARYKPYSDNIISAFIIFFLFFNIFKNLPSIINGMSAIENDHQTREHRIAVQQKKEGGNKK